MTVPHAPNDARQARGRSRPLGDVDISLFTHYDPDA